MQTKPTWFHYLPEVGRPLTTDAEDVNSIIEEANRLRKKADEMEIDYNHRLEALAAIVSRNWQSDEIQAAKTKYQRETNKTV